MFFFPNPHLFEKGSSLSSIYIIRSYSTLLISVQFSRMPRENVKVLRGQDGHGDKETKKKQQKKRGE